jgi:hypothetical protein
MAFDAQTCLAPGDCFAAGNARANSTSPWHAWLAHWNGLSWTQLAIPASLSAELPFLGDLTCSSSTRCFLIGESNKYEGAVLVWNGSGFAFNAVASGPSLYGNALEAVGCLPAECLSIGIQYLTRTTESVTARGIRI